MEHEGVFETMKNVAKFLEDLKNLSSDEIVRKYTCQGIMPDEDEIVAYLREHGGFEDYIDPYLPEKLDHDSVNETRLMKEGSYYVLVTRLKGLWISKKVFGKLEPAVKEKFRRRIIGIDSSLK